VAEQRYPTVEEFWRRLEVRGVEPDLRDELRDELRARTSRERGGVRRLPAVTTVAVVARLLPKHRSAGGAGRVRR